MHEAGGCVAGKGTCALGRLPVGAQLQGVGSQGIVPEQGLEGDSPAEGLAQAADGELARVQCGMCYAVASRRTLTPFTMATLFCSAGQVPSMDSEPA